MVICLERGADLHMAQLMPLPLTVSCFTKIQIGFTFLVPAHLGSPGKGPLNGCYMPGHSVQTRDVNSREIDFARVHTFYRRDWSVIAGGGANGGRRSPASPRHHCRPMPGPHCRLWTIDIAGGGVHETSQNGRGRVQRSATGEAQWPSAPGRRAG